MKAFLTGGTGHIGSTLIEVLLKRGYDVHCLIRETSNLTFLNSLNSEKLVFETGDLTSPESILNGIKNAQPDYVFHSAAALGRWGPWKYFHDLNVLGTKYVVEAVEKTSSVKKLVHVSTFAVYGYRDHLNIKEDHPYGTLHHSYSETKMMAEQLLWEKYDEGNGLPISIIRPPSVFGPYDRRNLTELLGLIKQNRAIVPGKGEQINSWAYTYDIADLLIKMAESDRATGEAFNVKTGDFSSEMLIKMLVRLLEVEDVKIRHIPIWLTRIGGWFGSFFGTLLRKKKAPLFHRQIVRMVIHHHSCNIDKAKDLLGWTPQHTLEEALRTTIDWFIKSGTYDAL